LTDEERRRYAELQKNNQVLTGTELGVALRQLNAVDRSSSAAQQARDFEEMTDTIARLRARLKAEVSRKDKLQQQALASMAKVEQLKAMQAQAQQSCLAVQQRVASSLESRIASNRDRVTSANGIIRTVATDANMSPLLCIHPLSAIAQADAECESRIRSSYFPDHAPSPPAMHSDADGLSLDARSSTSEFSDVRADYVAEARVCSSRSSIL
jgi:imidazolonepropionase-like amidohydrolase